MRITDNDKLIRIALEYASIKRVFTCRMLFEHILRNDIKFKKSMDTRRIGYNLSSSPLFKKLYKKKNVQYYTLTEEV